METIRIVTMVLDALNFLTEILLSNIIRLILILHTNSYK